MAFIGVDLGGTKIFAVLAKGDEVVAEAKRKTPLQGGPLGVVDAIAAVVAELGGTADVEAVGVGAPGAVDVRTGTVRQAPNLPGWHDPFGLGEALSDALDGTAVWVDNDVNVGTLAEHRLGAGRGATDMLGVFVGTGVGGGLILDGAIRRGLTSFAGEIGHTIVVPRRPPLRLRRSRPPRGLRGPGRHGEAGARTRSQGQRHRAG